MMFLIIYFQLCAETLWIENHSSLVLFSVDPERSILYHREEYRPLLFISQSEIVSGIEVPFNIDAGYCSLYCGAELLS